MLFIKITNFISYEENDFSKVTQLIFVTFLNQLTLNFVEHFAQSIFSDEKDICLA